MEAGEGKTLTATLPCVLHGFTGRGVLVATANDYLARRDADWMGDVYRALGLSVGVIEAQTAPNERRSAYACDVTYGTAKEFGFDFLRDRLLMREAGAGVFSAAGAPGMTGQRRYFALVDEADSLLIDEARTPLIISAAPATDPVEAERYGWAARAIDHLSEGEHFKFRLENDRRLWELTAAGRRLVRDLPRPAAVESLPLAEIYEFVERAVRVSRDFLRDRQYVVRPKTDGKSGASAGAGAGRGGGEGDDEVVIIDEYTGRPGEGRRWREGVHQAIEAKEGVTITAATRHAAQITVQEYFALFERVAGMTGTARTSAREFRSLYRRRVVPVPTNRPVVRHELPPAVLDTQDDKWAAIVEEVRDLHDRGRPVLVGTRSIDKSEHLSGRLAAAGISHQVLNARNIPAEAKIVAQAGQAGKVTVATNMAGRGTDILLGPGVADLGGLHVICSELHEAARIDRQLYGRCGRQGDPGSFRQYFALDDELLREAFGAERAGRVKSRGAAQPGAARVVALFRRAQRIVERRHFRQRRLLMHVAKERRKMLEHMGLDPYLDTVE
jgi:preprotein translocase subunit SecA